MFRIVYQRINFILRILSILFEINTFWRKKSDKIDA